SEPERADAPALALVQLLELQHREAQVEARVVHRLPRAETVEQRERLLHVGQADLDPVHRDVAVAEVVRDDRALAGETLTADLEALERFLEQALRRFETALVQLQVREKVHGGRGPLVEPEVAALLEGGLGVERGAREL